MPALPDLAEPFAGFPELASHAEAVFGDRAKAGRWMKAPLALLGNVSPFDFLLDGGDAAEVETILTRIEHNIPS